MRSTEDVFNHHLQALAAGNVPEVLKDYTEKSKILVAGQGVTAGLQAIRTLFETLVSMMPGAQYAAKTLMIEGTVVFIEWSAQSPQGRIENGVDTFVVEDDAIVYQTVRFDYIPA